MATYTMTPEDALEVARAAGVDLCPCRGDDQYCETDLTRLARAVIAGYAHGAGTWTATVSLHEKE